MKAFVLLVSAAGLAALAAFPGEGLGHRPTTLLLLVLLAGLAGSRPVRIARLRLELTASDPFVLVGLAAFGGLAAALTGLAGVIGATVGKGRRPAALRLGFNLAAVVLAAAAAAAAFAALGGETGTAVAVYILPLAAATAVYFICNTGLVAMAIALERRQPLVGTWASSFLWSCWSPIAALSAAVAMLAVIEATPLAGLALGIAPCWLLLTFYRAHAAEAVSTPS